MNEWLKKNSQSIKEKWGKWSPIQKGIGAAVVVVVLIKKSSKKKAKAE